MKVVWLESHTLLTYYHDHIRTRILLVIPAKLQSPYSHTRSDIDKV